MEAFCWELISRKIEDEYACEDEILDLLEEILKEAVKDGCNSQWQDEEEKEYEDFKTLFEQLHGCD